MDFAPIHPSGPDRRRGAALVATLGILLVVSALALQALSLASAARRSADAEIRMTLLRASACEAVKLALQRLADDDDLQCDHPGEPWARPEAWTTPEGARVSVRVFDESALFDVNNGALPEAEDRAAAADLLADVLHAAGHPAWRETADALRDATDPDHEGIWDRPQYDGDQPGPNRALLSPAELIRAFQRAERGMDMESRPWAELVVAHPIAPKHPEPININTAPEPILQGLFGPTRKAWVAGLIELRDAAPLRSLDSVAVLADPLRLNRIRPFLDVRSRWFNVVADAAQSSRSIRLQARVYRHPDGRVQIMRWTWLHPVAEPSGT